MSGRFEQNLWLQKRREEDQRQVEHAQVAKYFSTNNAKVAWEAQSQKKWIGTTAARLDKEYVEKQQQELDERRARLVEYLKNEDDEAFRKLESIEITPEQRRSQMADRAREARLAKEKAFAEEQKERQWRMNCDELRGLESAAITKEVFKARGEQQTMVDAKKKQEQQEREALEKAWLEMAEKKRIEEERYRQERAQKELDRVRMLDEQKRAVQEVKLREREQEAKLYEQQRTRWSSIENEAKEEETQRKQSRLDAWEELRRENQNAGQLRKQEDDAEKERLVRENIEREQMDKAREEAEADAAKLYYDDVHKQAELKSHAQTEEEHKYAQLQEEREDTWNKEKRARDNLMSQVQAERERQLQEREAAKRAEKEEKLKPWPEDKEGIMGAFYRKDEADIKKKHQVEQRQMLEQQIKERDRIKNEERMKIEEENRRRAEAYAAEQRKIEQELAKAMSSYEPGKARRTFH